MNIVVDDLLVNYELLGKGKLLLLLHGWGDSSAGLTSLSQALAEHYKVLTLDLPGFGASEPPHSAWNLDNYSAFLAAFFDKLKLENPYAIVAHSNGGAIAIRALSLKLIKPNKLILIAASGIRNMHPWQRLILKVLAKAGNIATIWLPERYRQQLRKTLYGVAGSDMLAVPEMTETFKRSVRQDVQMDAAKLDLPTLLIYAKRDRAVPIDAGERYNRLISNSELEVVKDAGHFVHLDQPELVVNLIEKFLQ